MFSSYKVYLIIVYHSAMVAIGWIKLQTKLNIAFYDIFSKLSEYAHETESFDHLQTLKIIYDQEVIID